jgi:hypothetical protein
LCVCEREGEDGFVVSERETDREREREREGERRRERKGRA